MSNCSLSDCQCTHRHVGLLAASLGRSHIQTQTGQSPCSLVDAFHRAFPCAERLASQVSASIGISEGCRSFAKQPSCDTSFFAQKGEMQSCLSLSRPLQCASEMKTFAVAPFFCRQPDPLVLHHYWRVCQHATRTVRFIGTTCVPSFTRRVTECLFSISSVPSKGNPMDKTQRKRVLASREK